MPNILLVPVKMLMKLMQKPVKEISTNLRKSVKLLYITCSALNMIMFSIEHVNMFSIEHVCRKIAEWACIHVHNWFLHLAALHVFNIIFECGTLCRTHVALERLARTRTVECNCSSWSTTMRTNAFITFTTMACTLLVPANIRAITRRYQKVRHTQITLRHAIVRQLCYPSKVSPPIVVKLAFSLWRHIRRMLAIIQSESTTHGTSLTGNGSSVDAACGRR